MFWRCVTLSWRCFKVGHYWRCINVVQRWKSGAAFCFIFNVGSTLFQRWFTTLKQCWSMLECWLGTNTFYNFNKKAHELQSSVSKLMWDWSCNIKIPNGCFGQKLKVENKESGQHHRLHNTITILMSPLSKITDK